MRTVFPDSATQLVLFLRERIVEDITSAASMARSESFDPVDQIAMRQRAANDREDAMDRLDQVQVLLGDAGERNPDGSPVSVKAGPDPAPPRNIEALKTMAWRYRAHPLWNSAWTIDATPSASELPLSVPNQVPF